MKPIIALSNRRRDPRSSVKTFEGSGRPRHDLLTFPSNRRWGTCARSIATSSPAQLSGLSEPYLACAPDTPDDEVAALFDKYNLITLAVADEHGRIAGIITADDVITMLRHRH